MDKNELYTREYTERPEIRDALREAEKEQDRIKRFNTDAEEHNMTVVLWAGEKILAENDKRKREREDHQRRWEAAVRQFDAAEKACKKKNDLEEKRVAEANKNAMEEAAEANEVRKRMLAEKKQREDDHADAVAKAEMAHVDQVAAARESNSAVQEEAEKAQSQAKGVVAVVKELQSAANGAYEAVEAIVTCADTSDAQARQSLIRKGRAAVEAARAAAAKASACPQPTLSLPPDGYRYTIPKVQELANVAAEEWQQVGKLLNAAQKAAALQIEEAQTRLALLDEQTQPVPLPSAAALLASGGAQLTTGTATDGTWCVLQNEYFGFGRFLGMDTKEGQSRGEEDGPTVASRGSGLPNQPYYKDPGRKWKKLTYSTQPLHELFHVGGADAAPGSWNNAGKPLQAPAPPNGRWAVDASRFVQDKTDGNFRIGTGTLSVRQDYGQFWVTRDYTLAKNSRFATIDTMIETKGSAVTNLRHWIGTADDYIAEDDSPIKTIGRLDKKTGFVQASNSTRNLSDRQWLKVTNTKAEGHKESILFGCAAENSAAVWASSRSMSAVASTNPHSCATHQQGDDSYGLFTGFGTVPARDSRSTRVYYGCGAEADLAKLAKAIVKQMKKVEAPDLSATLQPPYLLKEAVVQQHLTAEPERAPPLPEPVGPDIPAEAKPKRITARLEPEPKREQFPPTQRFGPWPAHLGSGAEASEEFMPKSHWAHESKDAVVPDRIELQEVPDLVGPIKAEHEGKVEEFAPPVPPPWMLIVPLVLNIPTVLQGMAAAFELAHGASLECYSCSQRHFYTAAQSATETMTEDLVNFSIVISVLSLVSTVATYFVLATKPPALPKALKPPVVRHRRNATTVTISLPPPFDKGWSGGTVFYAWGGLPPEIQGAPLAMNPHKAGPYSDLLSADLEPGSYLTKKAEPDDPEVADDMLQCTVEMDCCVVGEQHLALVVARFFDSPLKCLPKLAKWAEIRSTEVFTVVHAPIPTFSISVRDSIVTATVGVIAEHATVCYAWTGVARMGTSSDIQDGRHKGERAAAPCPVQLRLQTGAQLRHAGILLHRARSQPCTCVCLTDCPAAPGPRLVRAVSWTGEPQSHTAIANSGWGGKRGIKDAKATIAEPDPYACSPLTNDIVGGVVVIRRVAYEPKFSLQAYAQQAGAEGVLIVSNDDDDMFSEPLSGELAGTDKAPEVTIPVLMIGRTVGSDLIAAIRGDDAPRITFTWGE